MPPTLLFHHATKGRRFKLRVDRAYERCFFDSLKSKTRKASAPPSRNDMAQLKWEKRERRAEKKERNVCRKDLALRCREGVEVVAGLTWASIPLSRDLAFENLAHSSEC